MDNKTSCADKSHLYKPNISTGYWTFIAASSKDGTAAEEGKNRISNGISKKP